MPKVTGTRKQKAIELLARLERGPLFSEFEFTPEQAKQAYQRWAESWILADLKELIPELKTPPDFDADQHASNRVRLNTGRVSCRLAKLARIFSGRSLPSEDSLGKIHFGFRNDFG